MHPTEFAYAAGYIDGDGCFCIANNFTYSLSICTVNIENAKWFKERFEGTFSSRYPKDKNRKQVFTFRFNTKGLKILPEIEKFLIEKKEECKVFNNCRDVFLRRDKSIFYEEMKRLKSSCNLIYQPMKDELKNTKISIVPNETDFAYLAGFVDAECSLDILRRKQPVGGQFSYVAQIQCNNTKFPFFKWVADRFGGNFYFLNNSKNSNRRNQMIWRIRGKECYQLLEKIYPFLNYKKTICSEILRLKETEFLRKDCPSPAHPRFMEWFEPMRKIKESIYQSVCHLNNPI